MIAAGAALALPQPRHSGLEVLVDWIGTGAFVVFHGALAFVVGALALAIGVSVALARRSSHGVALGVAAAWLVPSIAVAAVCAEAGVFAAVGAAAVALAAAFGGFTAGGIAWRVPLAAALIGLCALAFTLGAAATPREAQRAARIELPRCEFGGPDERDARVDAMAGVARTLLTTGDDQHPITFVLPLADADAAAVLASARAGVAACNASDRFYPELFTPTSDLARPVPVVFRYLVVGPSIARDEVAAAMAERLGAALVPRRGSGPRIKGRGAEPLVDLPEAEPGVRLSRVAPVDDKIASSADSMLEVPVGSYLTVARVEVVPIEALRDVREGANAARDLARATPHPRGDEQLRAAAKASAALVAWFEADEADRADESSRDAAMTTLTGDAGRANEALEAWLGARDAGFASTLTNDAKLAAWLDKHTRGADDGAALTWSGRARLFGALAATDGAPHDLAVAVRFLARGEAIAAPSVAAIAASTRAVGLARGMQSDPAARAFDRAHALDAGSGLARLDHAEWLLRDPAMAGVARNELAEIARLTPSDDVPLLDVLAITRAKRDLGDADAGALTPAV